MKPGVPAAIVAALGLTQIIGYGTLYYSFSILAPGMARDLGLSVEQVFGVFSASLFAGGLSAPFVGGWMDRLGAAMVMTIGSAISALALLLCAWSPSIAVFALSIVLLEVASGMVQYQAAFAALVESRPMAASRSITCLTLIGGFASTIFWPIAASLHEHFSWREIYIAYAALNLIVCLPLHYWIMWSRRSEAAKFTGRDGHVVVGALPVEVRRRGMLLVSLAFALQGFTLSAMLTHMVPMLGAIGFGTAAVVIGSLFGPSQVLSRLINMAFGKNLPPPALATLSAALIVAGVLILGLSGTWLPGAVAFAICLGLGSGINSIAQGSLPLWMFGSGGYGAITGRMAAARLAAGAMAPFVFSVLMERFGSNVALMANACLGAVGMAAFVAVASAAKRTATATS
ncbi:MULTISPECIES: arsenite efflux MFS transporter ArsK [unclassified Sinorhizobium]|uniref:arsenite efflux MFS transporter ArsK n=1 Tax=unclassified Sinorhizobium TaxID=2613772 RepID=UPI0024C2CF8E|nr:MULTISPECIES: arsenite efflux MFS transporter ArsK [unclassified Sinorhizobium]MDK1373467.1 arsenite efflux MFS transporter ArsK [Sinorhizobium sp. 6-70]MDK1482400.1 arsenite efflux MFS transporter ArsK [Sinorhizobium sp. 6-117]